MNLFGKNKKDVGEGSSSPVVSEKTKGSASFLKKTANKIGSLFSSKKNSEDTAEPMSNTEYLGEIYKLMVKNRDDIKFERQQQVNHREEEDSEEQKRHSEIIKALTIRRRPKPKRVERRERKAEEKVKKKEEPAKKPGKPAEPAKPTEPAKKPSEPSKPAEPPKKPSEPAKPSDPGKQPPKEPPKQPPKEAPKEPPKQPSKEAPKEPPKQPPKEAPKEPPKQPPKEAPKEPPKPPPKEPPKPPPKEPPKPPKEPPKQAEPVRPPPQPKPSALPIPPSSMGKVAVISALVAAGYSKAAQANILANVKEESNFVPQTEKIERYTGKNLMGMYGGPQGKNADGTLKQTKSGTPLNQAGNKIRFNTIEEANALVKKGPDAVAEVIYGGRMGNDKPGDGAKYVGRGYIQLTGKDAYKAISKMMFNDDRLVKNPELANDPKIAADMIPVFMKWKKYSATDLENVDTSIKAIGSANEKSRQERKKLAAEYNSKGFGDDIDSVSKQNKDMKQPDKSAGAGRGHINVNNVDNTTHSSNPPKVDDRPAYQRK